jgi:hypothetical protein
MEATASAGVVAVAHDGRDLLRYRAETAASKPHVSFLGVPGEAPAGRADRNLALAAPHDHAWHLGLFFCQKLVDGLNCWESERERAAGRPHGYAQGGDCEWTVADRTARIEQAATWRADDGEALLDDERVLTVHPPRGRGYLVEWTQTLEAVGSRRRLGSETLHGHYSGLSLRFARDLAGGEVRLATPDPADADDPTDPTAAWCDYSGALDGQVGTGASPQAGVTFLSHPSNDPHPMGWFTMTDPFGFVAANPTRGTVLTVEEGASATWRFGAWVHRGRPARSDVERVQERFLDRAAGAESESASESRSGGAGQDGAE